MLSVAEWFGLDFNSFWLNTSREQASLSYVVLLQAARASGWAMSDHLLSSYIGPLATLRPAFEPSDSAATAHFMPTAFQPTATWVTAPVGGPAAVGSVPRQDA